MTPTPSNRGIVDAWNTVLFEKFCRFRHLLVEGLAQHGHAALERSAIQPGERVLDVGSGFGDTTLQIAERVGPQGEAVGVDCADNFVRLAEDDARRQGRTNARFIAADAQDDALGGPYDHAFSRFGTMFFSLPGVAMRNLRDAVKPGGSLIQVVWRRREENPWLHEAELRVRSLLPVPSPDTAGQVHCGPGPFSMAGADGMSALLRGAGWRRIAFERHDCDICIGRNLDDAVEFALALGPAGEIMRLAGDVGQARRPLVLDALKDALAPFVRSRDGGGVWAPSSTWLVSAVNPG